MKRPDQLQDFLVTLHSGQWFGWNGNGTEWENLVVHDDSIQKPTKQECEDGLLALQNDFDSKDYQRKRANEYPPIADYLDGVVKNDQQQIQMYIDACLAVKAKYPKTM